MKCSQRAIDKQFKLGQGYRTDADVFGEYRGRNEGE